VHLVEGNLRQIVEEASVSCRREITCSVRRRNHDFGVAG
jgi:hypothetical protein